MHLFLIFVRFFQNGRDIKCLFDDSLWFFNHFTSALQLALFVDGTAGSFRGLWKRGQLGRLSDLLRHCVMGEVCHLLL